MPIAAADEPSLLSMKNTRLSSSVIFASMTGGAKGLEKPFQLKL